MGCQQILWCTRVVNKYGGVPGLSTNIVVYMGCRYKWCTRVVNKYSVHVGCRYKRVVNKYSVHVGCRYKWIVKK